MTNKVLTAFFNVCDKIASLFGGKPGDSEVFLVEAAEEAAKTIDPTLLKIVADCTLAAEQAIEGTGQGDAKRKFAFGNIVAIAAKDLLVFTVSDINYAIEAVIKHRNIEAAKLAAPLPDPSVASGAATAG